MARFACIVKWLSVTNLEEKMGEQSAIVPHVTAKGSYSQSAILILRRFKPFFVIAAQNISSISIDR